MAIATGSPPSRRAARAPGVVFAALAGLLVVLVAAALSPTQPPPPPVAEYAPEAVQAVQEAPPEQVSESGIGEEGEGGEGGDGGAGEGDGSGGTTTTTTPSAAEDPEDTIETERVRRCVGDPPRQTEDPQSPPCVAFWEGDNGGATARGVTENEIRIVAPNGTTHDFDLLLRYFNTRFEFYGRELTLVEGGIGFCFGGTPSSAKNLAVEVAKREVFASISFCDNAGTEYYYYDELARRGVVSVSGLPSTSAEADLAGFHPYQWTYLPTYDKGTRHLAELACSLEGLPAEHAGPQYVDTTRKFGLISNVYTDAPSPDLTPFRAALAGCGIEVVAHTVQHEREGIGYQGASEESTRQVQNALLDMKLNGVTTIILLTHANTTKQVYAGLESQAYQPEVMISTYLYNDPDLFMDQQPRSQTVHTFGISTWNKGVRVADEFWYQAIKEVDPAFDFPYKPFTYFGARHDYTQLLMLAAGIQMAGPNLTPETFAQGLQRAQWPNPAHSNEPGKVTIGPGTHSYMEDAAVIWWHPTNGSEEYGTSGGFCYVDNGARRRLGEYPKGAPGLFGECLRY